MKKLLVLNIFCLLFAINAFAQAESDLVITEILYNQPGNDTLEFIELYNKGSQPLNLEGYKVTSGFDYVFPNYVLQPGSYVVVARYADFFEQTFGIKPLEWTSGALSNSGEKIVIKTPVGLVADSVEYDNKKPWDNKADGEGSSLVLCDVNSNNAFGYNWDASNDIGGIFEDGSIIYASPGTGNSICKSKADTYPPLVTRIYAPESTTVKVVFNEPLNSATAQNASNYTKLNVSSAVLSSSADTVTLTLSVPLEIGILNTLTISNVTDALGNVLETQDFTFRFNNTRAPLVITEIMYNNPGADTLEFIELFNNGPEVINIGGYYFTEGIVFEFPSVEIQPKGYIVICANKEYFDSFFETTNSFQWTSGSLNNDGERITIKNTAYETIDQVEYYIKAPWPKEADGDGPSLVLCDASKDNAVGANWTFSDVYVKDYLGVPVYASPGSADTRCGMDAIDPTIFSKGIKVYPNPSAGIFNIEMDRAGRTFIEVLNNLGQVVYIKESASQLEKLDLSDQQKGIYYIRMTSLESGAASSTKVVVE